MKMRHEFDYIRKYNSDILKFVTVSNNCNKKIKANLKELEYYRIAKPVEGLNDFYQVMIRQIIINKKIEDKLRELEYYKTAKPIKGLCEFYQIMIRQIIIQKMTELYKELERLKDHARCLATRQSLAQFLVELYTVQY